MICEMCGEPIDQSCCPYCGTIQEYTEIPAPKKELRCVNIKEDLPTVETALKRLDIALREARTAGYKGLKVIHGYGSSGRGGSIKTEVHRHLHRLYNQEQIQTWIPGEEFSGAYDESYEVLKVFPFLKKDCDFRKANRGLTIIVF